MGSARTEEEWWRMSFVRRDMPNWGWKSQP